MACTARTQAYRGVQGFDLTTSCHLFNPRRAFAVAGALNAEAVGGPGNPIGIEVYPTRPTPWAQLDAEHLERWQREFGAPVRRVHVEFAADRAEVKHILRLADQRRSLKPRLVLRALYTLLPDADSGRGISLAARLGVGVNVHANVLVRWCQTSQLDQIRRRVPFVLAENNIPADYLYAHGALTFDPRAAARELVGDRRADGLLLGLDHLLERHTRQYIDPLAVLDDVPIQRYTMAIHLAGPQHGIVRPADPSMERLIRKVLHTSFAHPVRLAFDYSPMTMLGLRFEAEVRLFRETIGWIRGLQAAT
jgi:hypothetical protein